MKKSIFICCLILFITSIFAQEALKSAEEEYYDFLSLTGKVERPTLVYRTLSDSVWNFNDDENNINENVWINNNLGSNLVLWEKESPEENFFLNGIKQAFILKIYGPEWYNSYNTAAPFGQDDVALWQGKGYNTSLTGGIRAEGYGFELTLKPQLYFSQNREYSIMEKSPSYQNEYAYFWGYGVDAPQRFGDSIIYGFDWNDSEVRWTWKTFTLGFGTQSIWIGPAWLNPLLHSNNAPTYPKFDFGFRKTSIYLPFNDFYIGDFEFRMWLGKTSESKYFDDDETNNHNLFNGFNIAYSPFFLKGFTLGLTKVCLTKWNNNKAIKYLNPFYDSNVDEDQKVSITFDWVFPQASLEMFGELGVDDYMVGYHMDNPIRSIIKNPFHTMTFTFGFKKNIMMNEEKNIYGKLIFEWDTTEMSQDFQYEWPYNFGFHHIITQGYTNKGQWLGSGIGYGGNSQIIAYNIYYPKGNTLIFIQRNNPDNNFIYSKTITTTSSDKDLYHRWYVAYKANFNVGVETNYFFTPDLSVQAGLVYNWIMNNHYDPKVTERSDSFYLIPSQIHNFQFQLGLKYNF